MNKSLVLGFMAGGMLAACASTGGGPGSPTGGSTGLPAPGSSGGGAGSTGQAGASTGSASTGSANPSSGAAASPSSGSGAGAQAGDGKASDASGQRGGTADTGAGATTPGERRADLDSKLDASLGRFDEQLRREQQRTASDRDSRAAARANASVIDETANSDERRDIERDDIRRNRAGDLQSDTDAMAQGANGPARATAGSGADAKPIPSGADDDIVARRLRRAAENETDPELKEKLWKEYIDYKQNTKGSS